MSTNFGALEREPNDGNVENLRPAPPITLHAETLLFNLEHDLSLMRMFVHKTENDLQILKQILSR